MKRAENPVEEARGITWYRWYVVVFLLFAATISYVDRQILALMIGPVKRDLGISDTQVGFLIGLAFTLFYSAMTLPMAWFADRRSRRAVIGAGIFSWSLMTALSGFARNYFELFLARMGVGIGEATLSPAAYSLLADYFPKERLPFAVGVFAAAPFVGIGLANILGGSLVQYLEGIPPVDAGIFGTLRSWQLTFFAVGVPGILLAALALTIREPARKGSLAGAGEGASWAEVGRFILERRRFFALHFGGFLFLALHGWMLFAWIVEFFIRVHGLERGDIGVAYGLIAFGAGIGGSIFAGRLATGMLGRGSPDATLRLVVVCALAMWPLSIAMPLVPSATLAMLILVPVTFFMAWPPGLGVAALQAITPNEIRGRVIAIYLVVASFVAVTLGPLVGGFLNDAVFTGQGGIGYSIATLAAINYPAAAIILWFCLKPFRAALELSERWE